jgi:hypothetical protein
LTFEINIEQCISKKEEVAIRAGCKKGRTVVRGPWAK